MQSARIASYPCRIERGPVDWVISFPDVPQALAAARGVPGVFEAAESALVAALDALNADSVDGLPAASAPAPGEMMVTVRLGGPPLVRTSAPATPAPSGSDTADEDVPVVSGEVVDLSTETGMVSVRREGFWGWFLGLFGGSRSS
jgi:predicted RNase H-like HicB family nuclease